MVEGNEAWRRYQGEGGGAGGREEGGKCGELEGDWRGEETQEKKKNFSHDAGY